MMASVADSGQGFISLQDAVLCVDCEMVTTSTNDACPICGGRSLFSLFRILGGTLSSRKTEFKEEKTNALKYDLKITLKLRAMTARDLNDVITVVNRMTVPGRGCILESFHMNVDTNVESVTEGRQKAA